MSGQVFSEHVLHGYLLIYRNQVRHSDWGLQIPVEVSDELERRGWVERERFEGGTWLTLTRAGEMVAYTNAVEWGLDPNCECHPSDFGDEEVAP